jgi:hypothetical protein
LDDDDRRRDGCRNGSGDLGHVVVGPLGGTQGRRQALPASDNNDDDRKFRSGSGWQHDGRAHSRDPRDANSGSGAASADDYDHHYHAAACQLPLP